MKKLTFALLFFFCLQLLAYAAKFSFAVLGDNRDGDERFLQLIGEINRDKSIKFAVNTGDLTPQGRASEYENYWNMCKSLKVKMYDTLGNHDLGLFNQGKGIFKKQYGETYYYFDHENSRFIILDNAGSRGLGRKQLTWLKDALDTDKVLFIFLHKPLIDASGMYPNYVMTPRDENESLNKLLVRSKVRYVIAGHIHGYGREEKDNVVYLISGGAGAPLYLPAFNGGYYHYIKITVNGDRITDEVVEGREID